MVSIPRKGRDSSDEDADVEKLEQKMRTADKKKGGKSAKGKG